jgi:NAD(P)H-hydrate repair Nnr-like enzyme with NAD(P)H-hydrate epimerase domain
VHRRADQRIGGTHRGNRRNTEHPARRLVEHLVGRSDGQRIAGHAGHGSGEHGGDGVVVLRFVVRHGREYGVGLPVG